MATYAYCRVSTTQQADDGVSLEVQGRQCDGWALMKGVSIDSVFVEKGVSGSIPIRERQAGSKLFKTIQKGDTIVAAKLDRMFRDSLDALNSVEELREMGVNLVLLDLGTDPITNGLSKFFLTIVAAFANMERERIKERIITSKADARSRGQYLGGKIPFGYRVEDGALVEEPSEQVVIVRAKALKGEAKPLRTIQSILEAEYGRKLSLDALHRVLNRV